MTRHGWWWLVATVLLAGALPGCTDGGGGPPRDRAVPADARILVVFGLRRDDDGLVAAVRASSDPTSPTYGHFLTMEQVARRYGASAADRRTVLRHLADAGVDGRVDASGGAVLAPMTPAQVHDVLGAWPQASTIERWKVAGVEQALRVPKALRGAVTQVVGARSTVRAPAATPMLGAVAEPPCTPSAAATESVGRPSALGAWYGFDEYLYRKRIRGDGRRIGVLAIGRWNDASLDAFRSCYGTHPSGRVTVVPAPVTPTVPVGPEVALDVVVASSFAPDAQIDVLQYDPRGSLAAGFLEAVDAGAHGAPYDAVSTSIGYCEDDLEAGERAVVDHALLALAAVGTTVLASSGDAGAAACQPGRDGPSVQYPASSPWIAGVGGTAVQGDATGAIAHEVVWSAPSTPPQAGGGGTSHRYAAPWYQDGIDLPAAHGRRAVPDVAFLADPSVVPAIPICPPREACGWYQLAGTSAPAPALAAALALVSQDLSQRSGTPRRLGLLPPLVGHLAVSGRRSAAIHDVTEGTTRVQGLDCCDAAPGFDLASGWGSMELPALADAAEAARGG